jgi:hypothetical protein
LKQQCFSGHKGLEKQRKIKLFNAASQRIFSANFEKSAGERQLSLSFLKMHGCSQIFFY